MPTYKNEQKNTWFVSFYFTDWSGKRKKKKKEGFSTKKEALAFERNFLEQTAGQCNIRFNNLVKFYLEDCKYRLRATTYNTKATVIKKYLLPDFAEFPINEVTAMHIRKWQAKMMKQYSDKTNQYLHYINTQLSCIFNFAIKYYNLAKNPVKQCDTIGDTKSKKVLFWTLKDFYKFTKSLERKSSLHTMFNILFWTGIRRGELLALRRVDFNFKEKTLSIHRSKVFINSKGYISKPKTENSNRVISIPDFLAIMVKEYIQKHKITHKQLLFEVHPLSLARSLKAYCQKLNLKPIRLHDFRHSHASLLIEQGVSPLIIAERLGHKDINTTLRIYAHLYPNKQKYLAKSLNDLYEQTIK